MVWFVCQCGDSLKKPSVAKHLQIRRCASVTCVDCSKTFHGSEYESHIRCISEAEKYMGKLYLESSTKREGAKQDDWLNTVSETLNSYEGPLKPLVDRLAQYDNIPRKQKAFENFVINSLNLKWDPVSVSKLWVLISSCCGKNRVSTTPTTAEEWTSYKEETHQILEKNGGSLQWKLLQSHLAKRRKTTHPTEKFDDIRIAVLANIPSEYLADNSNMVSL